MAKQKELSKANQPGQGELSASDAAVESAVKMDLICRDLKKTLNELDLVEDRMQRTIRLGVARRQLAELLVGPAWEVVSKFKDSQDGFLTDGGFGGGTDKDGRKKEKVPYSDMIVRQCVVTALIKGLTITDQEFCILQGKCYVAKNGSFRILTDVYGATRIMFQLEEPTAVGRRWIVGGWISFEVGREKYHLDYTQPGKRLVLPFYSTDTPALVNGKAEAALFKQAVKICAGAGVFEEGGVFAGEEDTPVESDMPADGTEGDVVDGEVVAREEPAEDDSQEPGSTEEPSLLEQAWVELEACEQISDVDKIYDKFSANSDLSPAENTQLLRMKDDRQAEIRRQRGQRSNGH